MKFQKRDIAKGDGSTGLYLKFKDGESRVGVFRGEVYEFFQVWENGKSKLVPDDHPGAKSRFRLNFITKEDDKLKAKIFDFPLTVYNQLADISEDYDLEKTAVKITRRGTGTDTVYSIIIAKDQPSVAQFKTIEAVELLDLQHKETAGPTGPLKQYAPGEFDEVPF